MIKKEIINNNIIIFTPEFNLTAEYSNFINRLHGKVKECSSKNISKPIIVLNLINVDFIDSIGLINIFRLYLFLKKIRGKLYILNLHKDIEELFKIVELSYFIPIISSLREIEHGR